MPIYKTPENSPKKQPASPPNPPVRNDIQYLNPPNNNNLARLALPQNLDQINNNPQGGNNRPNLAPRNNQNNQRRLF